MRLEGLPTPSSFASSWAEYQEDEDPVFNCMRPVGAVVGGWDGWNRLHPFFFMTLFELEGLGMTRLTRNYLALLLRASRQHW